MCFVVWMLFPTLTWCCSMQPCYPLTILTFREAFAVPTPLQVKFDMLPRVYMRAKMNQKFSAKFYVNWYVICKVSRQADHLPSGASPPSPHAMQKFGYPRYLVHMQHKILWMASTPSLCEPRFLGPFIPSYEHKNIEFAKKFPYLHAKTRFFWTSCILFTCNIKFSGSSPLVHMQNRMFRTIQELRHHPGAQLCSI